jgi:hypothetical protein
MVQPGKAARFQRLQRYGKEEREDKEMFGEGRREEEGSGLKVR